MGHLTFVSKRLSAVGNKRISQFFDAAREPHTRVIALVDSTWVFLLLSFYIVISWNMLLFKAWSKDNLNKKFIVAENFCLYKRASFADVSKCLRYQGIREMINRRIFKYIEFIFVHSFVGAFERLLKSPLNVGFLKRTFLLK